MNIGNSKLKKRAILLIVLLSLGASGTWFYYWHNIKPYLEEITPGMKYEAVLNVMPNRFIKDQKTSKKKGRPNGAVFTSPNKEVEYYMVLAYSGWILKGEYAEIFFDSNDEVIGVFYTSTERFWKPNWGQVIE
jgi:hypothetical protein